MTATPSTYKFTHKGKSYEIPAFNSLPMGALRKARNAKDDTDSAFIIIETVMGIDSAELAAVDSMTAAEFQVWLDGWTQAAPLGESSSSES